MTPETTREKAVVVEVARVWWLLWVGIGCAVAAVGVWRAFPAGHVPDKVKAGLGTVLAAGSLGTWSSRTGSSRSRLSSGRCSGAGGRRTGSTGSGREPRRAGIPRTSR
jgi:hypothetical protein